METHGDEAGDCAGLLRHEPTLRGSSFIAVDFLMPSKPFFRDNKDAGNAVLHLRFELDRRSIIER